MSGQTYSSILQKGTLSALNPSLLHGDSPNDTYDGSQLSKSRVASRARQVLLGESKPVYSSPDTRVPRESTHPSHYVPRPKVGSQKICESCEQVPATLYCIQCGGYLCQTCDLRVHSNRLLQKHERVPSNEYVPPVICKNHPAHACSHFCSSCQQLCCVECIVAGPHKGTGHQVQTLSATLPAVRERLSEGLDAINHKISELSRACDAARDARSDLTESAEAVRQAMRESFQELRARVDAKEQELLASTDEFVSRQSSEIDRRESSLGELVRRVEGMAGDVSRRLEGVVGLDQSLEQSESLAPARAASLIRYFCEHEGELREVISPDHARGEMSAAHHLLEESQRPRRCFLDVEAANRQLEQMEGMHLILAELQLQEK